jgi:hypothetical protein
MEPPYASFNMECTCNGGETAYYDSQSCSSQSVLCSMGIYLACPPTGYVYGCTDNGNGTYTVYNFFSCDIRYLN